MANRILPLRAAPPVALVTVVLLIAATAAAQRPLSFPVADDYGYTAFSSEPAPAPECASAFVDISATGTPLVLTASGAEPALDDGGALLLVVEPFELYGVATPALVVSSNGYLAAASSLAAESGGDFSGDCPLPAIPQPGPGVAARLAVLHADLTGDDTLGPGSDGTVLAEHFASCPRPSDALGDEPCTVVQWQSWALRGATGAFSFQAVLYHLSFEVVYQYGPGSPVAAPTAGLQSADARHGLAPYCAAPGTLIAGTALCLFDPRFPAGGPIAYLAVELDEKSESVAAVNPMEFTLAVANDGPTPASGVAVATLVPADLLNCSWSCSPGPGASCSAAGSGPIADTADLAADATAFYALTCDLALGTAGSSVTVTATAIGPADVSDPDPANNTASVTTEIPIPVTLQRFTVD